MSIAVALGVPLLGLLLVASDSPAWQAVPQPPSQAGAADGQASSMCDLSTALRTTTITLDETGVAAPCIVVSAGDLVTWVNLTSASIVIQTADDQFSTEDVSAVFSSLEVAAQAHVTVRLIHAGRIDYAAPDDPTLSGTILILGRGAA